MSELSACSAVGITRVSWAESLLVCTMEDVQGGTKSILKWLFSFAVPPVRVILWLSLAGGDFVH